VFAHDTFTSIFGAVRPGELEVLTGLIRAALRAGYAVVLNEPGTKKPLCPLTAATRRKADREAQDAAASAGNPAAMKVRHACGVHHALTEDDVGKVTGLIKRLTEEFGGTPNIGLEPGRSRLLAVDVDTATERDAFLADWAIEMGEEPAPTYTVRSPGVMREDGTWVHSEGGHFWFTLPDAVTLPGVDGEDGIPGVLKADGGWTLVWAGRQVLVPPSVRPEGPYACVGSPQPAPAFLTDRIFRHAEGRRERERIRLAQQAERRSSGVVDPVDAWSEDTPWAALLEPRGWVATGLVDTCSCPTWTAPGPHGSPKSATAHDIGCTRFDTDDGHAPLHVWTDNPPDYLAGAGRTLTKLTHEAYADHEGSESEAVSALGLAAGPVDPAAATAALELEEFAASLTSPVQEQSTPDPQPVDDGDDEAPESQTPACQPAHSGADFKTPSGLAEVVSEPIEPVNQEQDSIDEDAPGPWYDRNDLGLIPPPDPMISGVLDHRTMTVLAGKFGTYKTFLALDWAAAVATGTAWAGHEVGQAHPVVFIAAEGVGSFDRRLSAWEQGHAQEAVARGMLTIHHGPVNITDNKAMSALVAVIREKGARLVVIDTLSRCAPGLEENEAPKMAAALERLFMLRDALDIAVLVLHHTGHQGLRARGSSVLEDNADSSWVVKLNGSGDAASEDRGPDNPRMLTHRKSKDGELIADKPMVLKPAAGSAYLSFDAFDAPVRARDKRAAERAGEEAEMLTDIRTKAPSKDLTARALAREMTWNWDRKITRAVINIYLNE
jgi:hypothetical protein